MELIYGTHNPGKLASMRQATAGLGLHIIGLDEVNAALPGAEESGHTPLENARLKARAYYAALGRPVFSCDSGLYFERLPPALQPGLRVRRAGPEGRAMTDREMTDYYGGLARKFGPLRARYHNAICLILDEKHSWESMDESLWGEPFLLLGTPHPRREAGFPLDCLSAELASGRYFYDLGCRADERAVKEGFSAFFQAHLFNHSKE